MINTIASPPLAPLARGLQPRRAAAPPAGTPRRGAAVRAGPSAGESDAGAIDDAAFRSMSPAARQVFKEASENIMKLNSSRVRALRELKAANEKIAELERRLEQATQLSSDRAAGSVFSAPPDAAAPSAPPAAAPQGAPPPAGQTIVVLYETGWDSCYIHYQIDGKGWTKLPGVKLDNGSGKFAGKHVATLEGSRLEFVLTNGEGKFDTPNPYGEAALPPNYVIPEPGTWRLKSGRLERVQG